MYFFLLACAAGVGYLFYTIWIVPYFPQKRKGGAGKKSTERRKVEAPSEPVETETQAVSTGSKSYNEEWIPTHHMQRPEARRVKSGARPKSRGRPE